MASQFLHQKLMSKPITLVLDLRLGRFLLLEFDPHVQQKFSSRFCEFGCEQVIIWACHRQNLGQNSLGRSHVGKLIWR
jgi:hypothetical protein